VEVAAALGERVPMQQCGIGRPASSPPRGRGGGSAALVRASKSPQDLYVGSGERDWSPLAARSGLCAASGALRPAAAR